jgi:hypothetical protein
MMCPFNHATYFKSLYVYPREVHEFSVPSPWFMCSVTGHIPFRNSCLLRGQANLVECDIRNPNSCMADPSYGYCFDSNSAAKVMTWTEIIFG